MFLLLSVFFSFAIISQICKTFFGLGSCIYCNIVFYIFFCHVNVLSLCCFYFPSMYMYVFSRELSKFNKSFKKYN